MSGKPAAAKVLVIGLDAATFDLILPWAAEGTLPHLAALLDRGAHGPLKSVPNQNSLAAWTTFMTGKNPGKHGVYWFYDHKPGSYDFRFLNGGDITEPRFWELASEAGKRVCVMNVPMTYPARPLNGVLVAGMDAPDESSPGFAYPPEIATELAAGGYLIDTNILGYARSGRREQAIAATRQVIDRRAWAAEQLLRRGPWDLFAVVFTALDRIQHGFWQGPGTGADAFASPATTVSATVKAFYAHLDGVIGRLCAMAGDDATVMLVSDHGMGANPLSNMYLNPWLESLGLFCPAEAAGRGALNRGARYLLRRASSLADGLFSKRMRRRLMRLLPGGREGLVGKLHRVPCDWARTKAYADYIQPGIWVNLRGREPQGIVEPGEGYEALRSFLIDHLSRCRDIEKGEPIVQGVYRREEVYAGPCVDRAPDLHIEWNYNGLVRGYAYENDAGQSIAVGTASDVVERRNISGDHRPYGILMLAGPGVRPGRRIAGRSLADIAPTLLHVTGQPIPDDMDGEVILDAFTEPYRSDHPVTFRRAGSPDARGTRSFTDEESQQVEERLRGLGYLE